MERPINEIPVPSFNLNGCGCQPDMSFFVWRYGDDYPPEQHRAAIFGMTGTTAFDKTHGGGGIPNIAAQAH